VEVLFVSLLLLVAALVAGLASLGLVRLFREPS
jgi:hypothetical protein